MPEFREGESPSEEIETRSESQEGELRKLAEMIRRIPYPPDVLETRTEERFLEFLEQNPEMAETREMWMKFRSGERVTVPKEKIAELEKLRAQIRDEFLPQVLERLRKEPFIAEDAYERGINRCEECGEDIQAGWRMVLRNTKENPYNIDFTSLGFFVSIQKRSQEHRLITFLGLHELEEHPSASKVSLEDWKAFLAQATETEGGETPTE